MGSNLSRRGALGQLGAGFVTLRLGERQIENYQCDANPLRPFRPTLPEGE